MPEEQKNAIVIGASRGLGLGLVKEFLERGWLVTATYRSAETAKDLLELSEANSALTLESVDINKPELVADLARKLQGKKADILFVNAGISLGPDEKVQDVSREDFINLLATNAYSPMQVIEALDGNVDKQGVIAVMSSDLGSVENNLTGFWEVYRASKASLNTFMKSRAATKADQRAYLCLSPGWVRTDMGGEDAPLDVPTSASGLVETMLSQLGATGVQFLNYEGKTVAW
ncbi:MAG: SDR family NAD(P)-dependent oxidoreductase [Roseovarius sp.]